MRLDFFCKQSSLTSIISDRKGVTIEGKKKKNYVSVETIIHTCGY